MSEQSTAMVKHEEHAIVGARTPMFTAEQEEMIREMYAPTASDLEFKVLVSIARVRRLNPLLGHIHFVKRPNKITDQDGRDRWVDKWTCQVSIDGLRAKAEETGLYEGQDEPEFTREGEDGELVARVRVYKKGIDRPFVGVAFWTEFVQTTRKGDPVRMWEQMPRHMLAKCAEALALRKAFPEELAGLYTPDEMGQASNGRAAHEEHPASPRPALPQGPDARALAERASGATTPDACIEVLCAAKSMPRVRAVAYKRLIELSPDLTQLSVFVANVQSDNLPEDIRTKLLLLAEERKAALEPDDHVSQAEAS